MGVQHLEYFFGKNFLFLPEVVSMYGLQHSEFALDKKKMSYLEQFLCMVYDILSIAFRKKKIHLSFPLCNIV